MKNFFLKVSLLALVASFFVVPLLVNAATTPQTQTSIENTVPPDPWNPPAGLTINPPRESWTQTYVGGGTSEARAASSVTYPTNVGADVVFTGRFDDPNHDDYYMAICKTNAITANSNAAPTCTGGAWGVSTATSFGNNATVNYTTLDTDAESNAWYGFFCDKTAVGPACTTMMNTGSSSTLGDDGSPFFVNHRPRFDTVLETDSTDTSIAPGETIKFKLTKITAISDPDLNTAQDTVSMYICTPETTGFDYKTPACTGGSTVCSHTGLNPVTTDAVCNDGLANKLNVIPTAHATYNYKVFVVDQYGFDATKKVDNATDVDTTQSYDVIDVPPYMADSNAYTVSGISVSAGLGLDKSYSVVIKDDNGDADITAATGVLYDDTAVDLVAGTCTGDQNNCYPGVTCLLSDNADYSYATGTTHGGASAITATATCGFTVFFNLNYSSEWRFHVNPADQLGTVAEASPFTTTYQSGAIASNPLSSLNIKESTIAYGTVSLDTVSSNTPQTKTQNFGNQVIDVQITGTLMCTDAGVCAVDTQHTPIARAQQKWSDDSAIDWETGNADEWAMVETASGTLMAGGCSDRNLAIRNVSGCTDAACAAGPGDQGEDEILYWKIKIPAATVAGSYTGTNTFTLATDSTCDGGH